MSRPPQCLTAAYNVLRKVSSLSQCGDCKVFNMQKAEDGVHFDLFSLEPNPYLLPVFLLKEHSAVLKLMEVCLSKDLTFVLLLKKKPSHCFLLVLPQGIRCLFFNQSPIGLRTKGKHSSTPQSDHKAKHNGQLQTDEWAHRHGDSAGQRDGLQPNHCHHGHHWKENNWKENWAKRGILFAEECASQHLVTIQPEQKPELLQFWVRRGTEPLLGTFSWRAGPHGTCTTFQLQWTGTCQQPQKHFRHSFSSQWSLKETGEADFVSYYRERLQEWGAKKEKMWSLDLKI